VSSAALVPKVIFEVPKTMDKLREDVGEWSLADDVGLMMVLEEVATNMKSKIRQVEREVDSLLHETSAVHVSLRNSFTSFSMLSQTQFVENRVYDNDDELIKPDASSATKSSAVADSLITDANKRHDLLVSTLIDAARSHAHATALTRHRQHWLQIRSVVTAHQPPRSPSTQRLWRNLTRRCEGEFTPSTTPQRQRPGRGPMATPATAGCRCRS
jgi:hypothetical protein